MGCGLQMAATAREPSRINEAVTPVPLSMESGENLDWEPVDGASVADDVEAGDIAQSEEGSRA